MFRGETGMGKMLTDATKGSPLLVITLTSMRFNANWHQFIVKIL